MFAADGAAGGGGDGRGCGEEDRHVFGGGWEGSTTGRRFVYVTVRQAQFSQSVFNNSFKSRADGQAVAGIGKEAVAIPGQNTPNDYRFLAGAIPTETLFIQVDAAGPNHSDGDALAALTTVMRTVVAALR